MTDMPEKRHKEYGWGMEDISPLLRSRELSPPLCA